MERAWPWPCERDTHAVDRSTTQCMQRRLTISRYGRAAREDSLHFSPVSQTTRRRSCLSSLCFLICTLHVKSELQKEKASSLARGFVARSSGGMWILCLRSPRFVKWFMYIDCSLFVFVHNAFIYHHSINVRVGSDIYSVGSLNNGILEHTNIAQMSKHDLSCPFLFCSS